MGNVCVGAKDFEQGAIGGGFQRQCLQQEKSVAAVSRAQPPAITDFVFDDFLWRDAVLQEEGDHVLAAKKKFHIFWMQAINDILNSCIFCFDAKHVQYGFTDSVKGERGRVDHVIKKWTWTKTVSQKVR